MREELKEFSIEELKKEIAERQQTISWAKGCIGKAYRIMIESEDGPVIHFYMPVYYTTDNKFCGTTITLTNYEYMELSKGEITPEELSRCSYVTWEEVKYEVNKVFEELPFML